MEIQSIISVFTLLITIVGWYVLHKSGQKRDLKNKRKDLRITYLIEAWKKLEYAANRNINEVEFVEHVEKPIALIQLFGSARQISLAKKIADDMAKTRKASFDDILENLRNDLREELNLDKTNISMTFMRFRNDK